MFALSLLLPFLAHSVLTMPGTPTTLRRRYQYTAPPLVIVRTDNDFVYDAKEDWWAYLSGLIGISAGVIILVYVGYAYDFTRLWRKEDPDRVPVCGSKDSPPLSRNKR